MASPNPLPLLIVAGLALMWVAWLIGQPQLTAWRRQRLQGQAFPQPWDEILRRRVPLVCRMPAELQAQLRQRIQVFLAEKAFIGCEGQVISDEVRVTIAAQACLLILNRPTDYYPQLRQILVYPSVFLVRHAHTDDSGIVQSRREVLSGESWSHGQVILAWDEAVAGARTTDDAFNVVLHEFAHQLDAESGLTNGAPELGSAQRYERWSRVMQEAYEQLTAQVERDELSLLDPYGATDPVEFFAVATETFFERAHELAQEQPALYGELADFYRVDPATW